MIDKANGDIAPEQQELQELPKEPGRHHGLWLVAGGFMFLCVGVADVTLGHSLAPTTGSVIGTDLSARVIGAGVAVLGGLVLWVGVRSLWAHRTAQLGEEEGR